jgi:threonine dehydratase
MIARMIHRRLPMSMEQRACGVICASAGNHAEGVAMPARHLGVDARGSKPILQLILFS